ncbi:MAG: arfA 2 [Myxococcaceae bacterium]|nr:arfA 2 [Myxococcaceae bacterium]
MGRGMQIERSAKSAQFGQIARNTAAAVAMLYIGTSASSALAACGDGIVELASETCDDGNVAASDGCNAACQIEAGYGCTGAPSLCCFSEAGAAFVLQGNSTYAAATGEVTLVPDLNNQVGVAWFRETLDFTRPFRINLRLYLGSRDADPFGNSSTNDGGADGGSVLFQRDPRGTAAQGTYGGELGAQGISPVIGVEFDTYNNGATYDDLTNGDEDHVSIFQTRATPASNHIAPSVCLNNGTVCSNYEDGRYHAFAVEWTGNADHHMKVYVDGALRIDLGDDLIAGYFAGDPKGIYFGFAASTGSARNLHKFCPAAPVGFALPRDTDRDGVDDSIDLDDDNDGRPDSDETGLVFKSDDPGGDVDGDGIPNYLDPDYWVTVVTRPQDCPDLTAPIGACDSLPKTVDFDGDGIPDQLDPDSDGDGVTDSEEDGNPDANHDGVLDGCLPVLLTGLCPGTRPTVPDSDGDGQIDSRDPDSDGDGTPDSTDVARLDPCIPNPKAAACKTGDTDGDGLPNGVECPDPKLCTDSNHDGTPDYQDPDQDHDGTLDGADPAPRDPCIPNAKSLACATGDTDDDGVPNTTDSAPSDPCVPDANALACPTGDHDGDGVPNASDPAPSDPCVPDASSVACASADTDHDGTPNGTDPKPSDPCVPDPNAVACATGDRDGDGVLNGTDPAPTDPCIPNASSVACANGDADHDGVPNATDPRPSDPCVPDANALSCGTGDPDGDGLSNTFECPGLSNCRDTDGDGLPDYEDPDSDDDGTPDHEECEDQATCSALDSDGDGIPDYLDPDRPQLAGGACSLSTAAGPLPSIGWLFATLIAWRVGRRWRRIPVRAGAREQARAGDA